MCLSCLVLRLTRRTRNRISTINRHNNYCNSGSLRSQFVGTASYEEKVIAIVFLITTFLHLLELEIQIVEVNRQTGAFFLRRNVLLVGKTGQRQSQIPTSVIVSLITKTLKENIFRQQGWSKWWRFGKCFSLERKWHQ